MKNTLQLTLFSEYFYAILNGTKTIEYRELKEYWHKRLIKKYDYILFRNGYGNNRPYMIIEFVEIKKTNKNYELYLGKIIKIGNIKIENEKQLELF